MQKYSLSCYCEYLFFPFQLNQREKSENPFTIEFPPKEKQTNTYIFAFTNLFRLKERSERFEAFWEL